MDQRLKHKANCIDLIEEKVGSTLEGMSIRDHILNIIPVAQKLLINWKVPSETEKLLKKKRKKKDVINKIKWQPTEWEKNLHQPHIGQRAYLQNIQRTQEIGQKEQIIK